MWLYEISFVDCCDYIWKKMVTYNFVTMNVNKKNIFDPVLICSLGFVNMFCDCGKYDRIHVQLSKVTINQLHVIAPNSAYI